MAISAAVRTHVIELIVGMFNAAPGADNLTDFTNHFDAGGNLTTLAEALEGTTAYKSLYPASLDNSAFAQAFINNLIGDTVPVADKAWVVSWVEAMLNNGSSQGSAILQTVTALNGTQAVPWQNAKTTLLHKVDVASWYSVDQDKSDPSLDVLQAVLRPITIDPQTVIDAKNPVTVSPTPTPTGGNFAFTQNTDAIVGTGLDDSISADETSNALISGADTLDGGNGTDTLTITNSRSVMAQVSNVEQIVLQTLAGDFDASTATGLVGLQLNNGDGDNELTVGENVAITLKDTQIKGNAGTKNDIVLNYHATDTSANLTLNNVSSQSGNSDLALKGAALTTLNITTTGAASTVDALLIATDTQIESYVFKGDQNLTINDALTFTTNGVSKANTLTSTAFSGALDYKLGTLSANQNLTLSSGNHQNTLSIADVDTDASLTATFGSAADVVTLTDATGSVSIDTGSGNDTVTLNQLDNKYNAMDGKTAVIRLGEGDDTLTLSTSIVEANLASGVTLDGGTGTDTLQIRHDEFSALFDNGVADVTVTGFETLGLVNNDSGTFDLDKVAGVTSLALKGNTGGALFIDNALNNSRLDWTVQDANPTAGGTVDIRLKDASGATDAFTLNMMLTSYNAALDNINFGDFEIQKDSSNNSVETFNIIADGALMGGGTGSLQLTDHFVRFNSLDLSGGVSTINVSGDASTKIYAFANATSLVTVDASLSSGHNILSTAAGSVFKGGSGNDTFIGSLAQFSALSSLAGNGGTDKMQINDTSSSGNSLVINDSALRNVSTMESVEFVGALQGDFTWLLGGYANTFATNNNGLLTVTLNTLVTAATGDDVTVDASGLSGANGIHLTLRDTAATGSANASKITVTGADGNDTLNITQAATGVNAQSVISVSGGSGNDTISVTVGSDAGTVTINGGSGNDSITGSIDADTITGGTGTDTMTGGGTGVNTFVFAAGDSGLPSATVFDTITDFNAVAGNIIDAGAAEVVVNAATAVAGVANISAAGVATFDAADTTFAQHLTAVEAGITTGTAAAGQGAMWQEGADAYLFISDGVDGIGANDILIKLTGLDTTNVASDTLTDGGSTFTIA